MALIVLLVNGILTVGIGRIPFFRYRRLLLVPLVFLLLSTIALLLNVSPVPLDGYALPLGSIYITASRSSLLHALQLICTAMASVSCLYFLALNTTMTDILDQFRRLHVPGLLVELMLLIYRYIFVLLDVAYHIITSQHSRLGNKDFKTACKSFGGMVSCLLYTSVPFCRMAAGISGSMPASSRWAQISGRAVTPIRNTSVPFVSTRARKLMS